MNNSKRQFLKVGAAGLLIPFAPTIVRADSLMKMTMPRHARKVTHSNDMMNWLAPETHSDYLYRWPP